MGFDINNFMWELGSGFFVIEGIQQFDGDVSYDFMLALVYAGSKMAYTMWLQDSVNNAVSGTGGAYSSAVNFGVKSVIVAVIWKYGSFYIFGYTIGWTYAIANTVLATAAKGIVSGQWQIPATEL